MLWIIGQLAMPYGHRADRLNRWVVEFRNDEVRRCVCVDRIERRILTTFKGSIIGVFYGVEKNALYLLFKPDRSIDTSAIGRILREEGVKDYEIHR